MVKLKGDHAAVRISVPDGRRRQLVPDRPPVNARTSQLQRLLQVLVDAQPAATANPLAVLPAAIAPGAVVPAVAGPAAGIPPAGNISFVTQAAASGSPVWRSDISRSLRKYRRGHDDGGRGCLQRPPIRAAGDQSQLCDPHGSLHVHVRRPMNGDASVQAKRAHDRRTTNASRVPPFLLRTFRPPHEARCDIEIKRREDLPIESSQARAAMAALSVHNTGGASTNSVDVSRRHRGERSRKRALAATPPPTNKTFRLVRTQCQPAFGDQHVDDRLLIGGGQIGHPPAIRSRGTGRPSRRVR